MAEATGRLDEQVRRAVGWFLGLGRFESYRGLTRDDQHLLPQSAISRSTGECGSPPRLCNHRVEGTV